MFISTLKNDAGWADVRAQLGLSASMMEVLGLLLAQESILIEQSMHRPAKCTVNTPLITYF